jgi:hypothetical protein
MWTKKVNTAHTITQCKAGKTGKGKETGNINNKWCVQKSWIVSVGLENMSFIPSVVKCIYIYKLTTLGQREL